MIEHGSAADLRHVSFHGVPGPAFRRPAPARRPPPPAAPRTPADDFAGWVLRQAGLDAGAYRGRVFARRIPSCLRCLGVSSLALAQAELERRPQLLPRVLTTLLIGVTGFFRDPEVFEAVRHTVLPSLAGRRWPPRVWSAACSAGPELYSMAILLDEAGLLDGAWLLGTDCRDEAVAAARAGVYDRGETEGLGAERLSRYFEPWGEGQVRVVGRLRAPTAWKTADLHKAAEPGPWDVVLWRNAAIYLEASAAEAMYRALAASVAPGGFLIVGKAERPPAGLGLAPAGRCVYRRVGGNA